MTVVKTVSKIFSSKMGLLAFIKKAYTTYGKTVVQQRALADFRDGLKPVHRRILWAMYNLSLHSNGGHKKSARVAGDCFAAGTSISTPDGSVAIESLDVGDLVLTSRGPKKITNLIQNKLKPMYKLELQDGKVAIMSEKQCVKIVIDGIFYWKPACDLTPQDEIVVET